MRRHTLSPVTTAPLEPLPPPAVLTEAAARPAGTAGPGVVRHARLATPILAHTGVDYLSAIGVALMPMFAVQLGLLPGDRAMLVGLASLASGLVQPFFAWLGDRHDTRIFGVVGVAMAAVSIGLLGHARSIGAAVGLSGTAVFAALFALASAGSGIFHPPAAATVGHLAGRRRSLMVSVFFMAGMLGGTAGYLLSPEMVRWFSGPGADVAAGLASLHWLIVPGLVIAAALALAVLTAPHRHADAHARVGSLSARERRRRWAAFAVLYAGNAIRFPVHQGLIYLAIEWAIGLAAARRPGDAGGVFASFVNGPIQGAMLLGMGGGGIAMSMLLKPRFEKPAFILLPILGALPVAIFPHADALGGAGPYIAAFALAAAAGFGFGGTFPLSISLGQRLLPHRTGLASGMLQGGAWLFGVVGSFLARALHAGAGLEVAFAVFAGVLVLSGVLMAALPDRLLRQLDPH